MTREEYLEQLRTALMSIKAIDETVVLTEETNLVDDGYLDSLDAMLMVYELEKQLGYKVEAIDETFDDFRVSAFLDALTS